MKPRQGEGPLEQLSCIELASEEVSLLASEETVGDKERSC